METIIGITHITKSFSKKRQRKEVLKDVSLEIKKGEFVGIIGKSGAGKTTILKIVGLLERPDSGELTLFGTRVAELSDVEKARLRNEELGFVLQDYALIDSYTVFENVEIPLNYSKEKLSKAEKREKIYNVLKKLNMEEHMDDSCDKLSGGERQRVAIARALINEPQIIIADEPTGALDEETATELLELLTHLNKSMNKTILLVTHDRTMLKNCTCVYELKEGKCC